MFAIHKKQIYKIHKNFRVPITNESYIQSGIILTKKRKMRCITAVKLK